jgi:hypothetical protein
VIVPCDGGFTLKCTECGRVAELTEREVRDGYYRTLRSERMRAQHAGCGVVGSLAASKAKRRAALQAAMKPMQ